MQRKFIRDKWGINQDTKELEFTSSPDQNGSQFALKLSGVGGGSVDDLFFQYVVTSHLDDDCWDVSCHTQIKEALRKSTWYSDWAVVLSRILNGGDAVGGCDLEAFDISTIESLFHTGVTERDLYKPLLEVYRYPSGYSEDNTKINSGSIKIPLWVNDVGSLFATSYTSMRIEWEPHPDNCHGFIYLTDIFDLVRSTDWARAMQEVL